MNDLFSNIVRREDLKEVQLNTLKEIATAVSNTAGPYGSNTIILGDAGKGTPDVYTKDGYKTLYHIDFFNPLEKSIQTQLVEVAEHIVHTVGDGTSSTVMMCYYMFKNILKYIENHPNLSVPKMMNMLSKCIDEVKDEIYTHKREVTLEDIYKICMISTNGNEEVSNDITSIYKEVGMQVYINVVSSSNTVDNVVKIYDGLTLEKGYASPAYINTNDAKCVIHNPRIYTFADPIDTDEMIQYLAMILTKNIFVPMEQNKPDQCIPTVIMAPSISRDATALLEQVETNLYKSNVKIPLLIIGGLNKMVDQYYDLMKLCDGKTIEKYIDPNVQKRDIEDGKAPSLNNITEWYGTCEKVEADNLKTKFINPKNMYSDELDDDGNPVYSDVYNAMVKFVESELNHAIKNDEDVNTIGNLRKRLNSLKANIADYVIGGISTIDRDSVKDLAEDAVLNCRSACVNGVGYGCNFEGYRATEDILYRIAENKDEYGWRYDLLLIINDSYVDLLRNIYRQNYNGDVDDLIANNLDMNKPINLRTCTYDEKDEVLCSIDTDVTILDAIKKTIIPMVTANQCLLLNPQQNKYLK